MGVKKVLFEKIAFASAVTNCIFATAILSLLLFFGNVQLAESSRAIALAELLFSAVSFKFLKKRGDL